MKPSVNSRSLSAKPGRDLGGGAGGGRWDAQALSCLQGHDLEVSVS